jgi:hypothetical protein
MLKKVLIIPYALMAIMFFIGSAHAGKPKVDVEDSTIMRKIEGGGREVINCQRGWIAVFGETPDSGVALIDLVSGTGPSNLGQDRANNVRAECVARGIKAGF